MNKKQWLEIGGVGVAIVALLVLLNRGGVTGVAPAIPTQPQTPNYLKYNQSNPDNLPLSNVPGLGGPSNTNGGAPLTCGGQAPLISFTGDPQFEQVLTSSLTTVVDNYQAAVLAATPDFVRQFFNNTVGTSEYESSINDFQRFGGAEGL